MLGASVFLGGAGGKAVKGGFKFLHQTHIDDLIPTHGLTMSRRNFRSLTNDIHINGVNNPIVYTQHNGLNYIVDGHHRANVARNLGHTNVPTVRVGLPYGNGYRSTSDLEYSDF